MANKNLHYRRLGGVFTVAGVIDAQQGGRP